MSRYVEYENRRDMSVKSVKPNQSRNQATKAGDDFPSISPDKGGVHPSGKDVSALK